MLVDVNQRLVDPAIDANATIEEQPLAGPSTPRTAPARAQRSNPLPKGQGRIIRDASGNVVGVELPDDDQDTALVADEDAEQATRKPMNADREVAPVLPKTDIVAGT